MDNASIHHVDDADKLAEDTRECSQSFTLLNLIQGSIKNFELGEKTGHEACSSVYRGHGPTQFKN